MANSGELQLLCAMLAQQLGLATEAAIARALAEWYRDKSRPLAEILQQSGDLDAARRATLEEALQQRLRAHQGDPLRSLAALRPSPSLQESLAGIDENLDSVVSWLTDTNSDDASVAPLADINVHDAHVPSVHESSRYEIKAPHARGGLGEVLVARDKQLDRDVALKQILPDYVDDPACRQRFVLEARVTGALEHPGIVPVYGLGVQPDGRPFYAMRFIRGDGLDVAITRLHDQAANWHLELRKLLHRFVSVCHAMHYAHSRGILHRDIKPSNIMLGPYGETLIVDWGLARTLTDPRKQADRLADERTLHPSSDDDSNSTRWGTLVGTPAYMSPEQALGWHDTLTPASDVYSLGATLYTILTGRAAFDAPKLGQLILDVQQGKFTRPRAWRRDVTRPLEAICLKAMATSIQDRYPSALELAEELERHLADEPVTAWREPWTARAGRWTRRHRGTTGAILAGMVAILVGLTVLAIALSFVSQRERALRLTTEGERRRADSNFQLAHGAIDRYLAEITDDPLLKQHGFEPLRRRLLENAREFYQELLSRRASDQSLATEQAWTHFRLGSIEQEIGTIAIAIDHYVNARNAFASLAATSPTGTAQEGQAMACINLASLYYAQGSTQLAQEQLKLARTLIVRLVKSHPTAHLQRQLAACFNNEASWALARDDRTETLASYQQALTIRLRLLEENDRDYSNIADLVALYGNLMIFHRRFGERAEADKMAQQAVSLGKNYLAELTDHPYAQLAYAVAQVRLADLHAEAGQTSDAHAGYLAGTSLLDDLVSRHPNVQAFRKEQASCENNLGTFLRSMNQRDEAMQHFSRAVDLCRQLVQLDRENVEFVGLLGTCLLNQATLQLELGHADAGRAPLIEALQIFQQIVANPASTPEDRAELARILLLNGQFQAATKDPGGAVASYQQAVELLETLARDYPTVPAYRSYLATAFERLGTLAIDNGAAGEAERHLRRTVELRQQLAQQVGGTRTKVELATAQIQLGRVLTALKKPSVAAELLGKAIEAMRTLLQESEHNVDAEHRLVAALLNRGLLSMEQSQFDKGLADFEELIKLNLQTDRVGVLCQRAVCLAQVGRHADAAQQIDSIRKDINSDVFALYDAAAVYAICCRSVGKDDTDAAAEKTALVARYRSAAIGLLKQLAATGYLSNPANRKDLLADPQFAAIRDHADFKAFLDTISK